MNYLDNILIHKRAEVAERKKQRPVEVLQQMRFFNTPAFSLKASLLDATKTGIIAEFKRKSPSKGIINNRNSVEEITRFYSAFGASGISILTDLPFFGGSLDDLVAARDNDIPLLRKDFIIDPYQVYEAKAFGADAILLIAACLEPADVRRLAQLAKSLGLEILLELHEESELDHLVDEVDMVGVNSRNLKTFEVNLDQAIVLGKRIGNQKLKIAESGIRTADDIHRLRGHGFQGFLIGEQFMKQEDPGKTFKEFTYSL